MTEQAKLKRRIKRLEKCIRDVQSMTYIEAREMAGVGAEDTEGYLFAQSIYRRLNRTLPMLR